MGVRQFYNYNLCCRRRLTSYMIRHLPKAPSKRYFVTGNYIYDYRSEEFGMGASMQALLIGNNKTHSPYIGFFKLEQEALAKYTDQYTVRHLDSNS